MRSMHLLGFRLDRNAEQQEQQADRLLVDSRHLQGWQVTDSRQLAGWQVHRQDGSATSRYVRNRAAGERVVRFRLKLAIVKQAQG